MSKPFSGFACHDVVLYTLPEGGSQSWVTLAAIWQLMAAVGGYWQLFGGYRRLLAAVTVVAIGG